VAVPARGIRHRETKRGVGTRVPAHSMGWWTPPADGTGGATSGIAAGLDKGEQTSCNGAEGISTNRKTQRAGGGSACLYGLVIPTGQFGSEFRFSALPLTNRPAHGESRGDERFCEVVTENTHHS